MNVSTTEISGLLIFEPRVFEDERGYFFESYKKDLLRDAGLAEEFVQDNQSFSTAGVVRGLHFQREPFAQGKLVRVIQGKVLDVAVDLRKNSPTFGKHHSVVLDSIKHNMFYIPPGFAHGFATLEDSVFSYKCTNYYNKASESGILWNDPDLDIEWEIEQPLVSPKDQALPSFASFVQTLNA
ncbi:MAG: dTDP-4-dehydrorhamnose 3,5-epimerase [Cytophagales bacterium]|nr:dTDP-4-dehydrorhamnose 3,5-epimerase [Cytophagales bacterium]